MLRHPAQPRRLRAAQGLSLIDRQHKANPFAFYAYLRWASPAHRVALADGRSGWLVTRYDDVAAILTDDRFTQCPPGRPTSRLAWGPLLIPSKSRNLRDGDLSTQARLLSVVTAALTPARLQAIRDRVTSRCERLLWSLRGRDQIDVIAEYARPIPIMMTADVLGVPEDEQARFVRWATIMLSAQTAAWNTLRSASSMWRFLQYINGLLRASRLRGVDDLLEGMPASEGPRAKLSDDELVAVMVHLLKTGLETTTNLIGNGVFTLIEHADQQARLRGGPFLLASGIDELARFSGPIEIAPARYACEDLWIAGALIPRGDMVLAAIASANRDHRQFSEPDVLVLTRFPNRHLSFQGRPHDVPTALLARLAGHVAIGTLLDHAELAFDTDRAHVRWHRSLVVRGLASLPMRIVRWRR